MLRVGVGFGESEVSGRGSQCRFVSVSVRHQRHTSCSAFDFLDPTTNVRTGLWQRNSVVHGMTRLK